MLNIDKSLEKFAAGSLATLMESEQVEEFEAPKVSVIIAVLDMYSGLNRTIESVINQDYPCIELILVVKKMHLRIFEMIKRLQSPLVKVYLIDDANTFRAYNFGSRFACGDYFIFVEPGDFFLSKNSIKNVFKRMSQHSDIIITRAIYTSEKGDRVISKGLVNPSSPISHRDVVLSSCFISSEQFRQLGRFDPNKNYTADIDLIARGIKKCSLLIVNINYVTMDIGQIYKLSIFPLKMLIEKLSTLLKYWGVFSAFKFLSKQKVVSAIYNNIRCRLKTFFYQGN